MKCIHCTRKAVFELRYSGHWICKRHFIELFEKRVKKTIRGSGLIGKEDIVLVALSGGKDSMTVLSILKDILQDNPNTRLMAVTVDEGLQGESTKMIQDYCSSMGVEHHIRSFKDCFKLTLGEIMHKMDAEDLRACNVCWVLKRKLINDFAGEVGVKKVATGHNLDDEIQEGFMNIIQGYLERMAGMKEFYKSLSGDISWVKVLRECPEDEVSFYANVMGVPHSKRRCSYRGMSYCSEVRRLLNAFDEKHPGSKQQMLHSIDELHEIMSR